VIAEVRTSVVAAFGALLLKLVTTGGYRAYVRPRMGPLLLLAGTALVGVAAGAWLATIRPGGASEPARPGPAHGRGHRSRLESLLLAPIVLLAVMPPAALGAAAASMRGATTRGPSTSLFPPLPKAVAGAVPLTVSDFVGRALYDAGGSLAGVPVRLVGVVAPDPGAPFGGFELVRFAMFCCAADAIPVRLHVVVRVAARSPPATDAWVEVAGTWRRAPVRPPGRFDPDTMIPTLDATSVRVVPEPADPYDPPF
jgi:uncharacterized repeat protein (TIGR03943 family)